MKIHARLPLDKAFVTRPSIAASFSADSFSTIACADARKIGSGEDSSEAGCRCPHGWICGRHAHTAEQDGCRKTGMQGEERAADMEAV